MTPTRSRPYLDYIRSLPCTVCNRRNGIEAHHVGSAAMAQKCADTETIPLCWAHHRECHRVGKKAFVTLHNLDIPELLRRLQAKPAIKAESGNWVARLERKEYILGPVAIGIEAAFRQAKQLWWEDRKEIA